MSDILADILSHKRVETAARMRAASLDSLRLAATAMPPPKPFFAALCDGKKFPVIAEIKRRSPSKGLLSENFSPSDIASGYANGGAACLSVLTDEKFFGGCSEDLRTAVAASNLPALRKDFILNEWQIIESRAFGADAILLIAAAMPEDDLHALAAAARQWGMDVLVEAHTPAEACAAAEVADAAVGINNRNLKTFQTDIQTTVDLAPLVKQTAPERLIISESGIHKREDIDLLRRAGVGAFLIGEALMREPAALARMFGDAPNYSNNNSQA